MHHHFLRGPLQFELEAANSKPIVTHGTLATKLRLGLSQTFPWTFVVADVPYGVLGVDFLAKYHLVPDLTRQRLIEASNLTSIPARHRPSSGCDIYEVHLSSPTPEIAAVLNQFPDLTRPSKRLHDPKHTTEHPIETVGPSVHAKPRRLRPEILKLTKAEVKALCKLGILRPSRGDWSSPVTVVPKKNKEIRLCGDYRALNSITKKDDYPMPRLTDATALLEGCIIFSNLDITRAYYNIPVRAEDQKKTAITLPFGLFEHIRMPFGLTNAPKTWQRFIDEVLEGLPFIFVYLDDILIFSRSKEEHLEHLRAVFERLDKAGLTVNVAKCHFMQPSVPFLGYKIDKTGFTMTEAKRSALTNLQPPKTITDLRSILGMMNFYHDTYPDAAGSLQPFTDLLRGHPKKKDRSKINWTPELLAAFQNAKSKLLGATALAFPDPAAEIRLTTDASDFAVGAVLEQRRPGDSEWRPLGFMSKRLNKAQESWATYDKELLAISEAIEKFSCDLEGRQFTVRTDHKPLIFLRPQTGKKRLMQRRARLVEFILQYSPKLEYLKGDSNVVADTLSRLDSPQETVAISAMPPTITLIDIAAAQNNDPEIQQLREKGYKDHAFTEVTEDNLSVFCEVFRGVNRPVIPSSIRRKVFEAVHNLSHPGQNASVKMVTSQFWWPDVTKAIRQWVKCCGACQSSKVQRHTTAPLQSFPPAPKFHHVHIDIVGPLEECNGFKYLCTFVDRWSRWPEAIPLQDISAQTIATTLVREWISRYGIPERLTSDRGRQFTSNLFSELTTILGVHHIKTCAYHPIANGALERWHRALKAALKCVSGSWLDSLPLVLLGLRTAIKTDSQVSASQLTFGCHLRVPGIFLWDTKDELDTTSASETYVATLQKAMEKLRPVPFLHKRSQAVFVAPELNTCSHVFVREDAVRSPLQRPYKGRIVLFSGRKSA